MRRSMTRAVAGAHRAASSNALNARAEPLVQAARPGPPSEMRLNRWMINGPRKVMHRRSVLLCVDLRAENNLRCPYGTPCPCCCKLTEISIPFAQDLCNRLDIPDDALDA